MAMDSLLVDEEARDELVKRLSLALFSNRVHVSFTDVSSSGAITTATKGSEGEFNQALLQHNISSFRVVSIPQEDSISPFSITARCMNDLINHHGIPQTFWDILSGFGPRSIALDESPRPGSYISRDGSSHETSYTFRYPERKTKPKRKGGATEKSKTRQEDSWTLRQTGVFHRFGVALPSKKNENLWIMLHPMEESKVQKRLMSATTTGLDSVQMAADPMRLHVLLLSSYVDNWRWFLHDMWRKYLELEDSLLTSDFKDRDDYSLSHDTLQTLSDLTGDLIAVPDMIKSLRSTLVSVIETNNTIYKAGQSPRVAETSYHLTSYLSKLDGNISAAEVLLKKIENTTKFLADSLNLQSQDISTEISGRLLILTKDTVDDSATVRTITVVTLIYLPATFIAGIFGTEFFNYQDSTSKVKVSPQFWIYLAVTVPLMLVTLGFWRYVAHRQNKNRGGKNDVEG